ncbi:MAG TPA: hypothetical protein VFD83_04245 [Candidatus Polarisedimenticolia bacterium]|nr:hypothetical protein [Candidatus Polarisedimenticolia bacterium]
MSGKSYIKLATDLATLPSPSRESVGYFFINNFLLSRIDSDMPSDLKEYDEDVNVYTASLLAGVVTGQQDLLSGDFISTRDADVFARVQETKDQRLRYRVYKANADFLYVSLGLFGESSLVGDAPEADQDVQSRFTGRGKSYYQFASAYAERLFGRGAAIAEVMDKLSRNFEAYTKVMVWMSGEYLHLMNQMSSGEMYHLEQDTQDHFEKSYKSSSWDQLLDSYVEWRKTHSRESRRRIARAARELRRIDPAFSLKAFRERWSVSRRDDELRRLSA